jgi:hypothetical protein
VRTMFMQFERALWRDHREAYFGYMEHFSEMYAKDDVDLDIKKQIIWLWRDLWNCEDRNTLMREPRMQKVMHTFMMH